MGIQISSNNTNNIWKGIFYICTVVWLYLTVHILFKMTPLGQQMSYTSSINEKISIGLFAAITITYSMRLGFGYAPNRKYLLAMKILSLGAGFLIGKFHPISGYILPSVTMTIGFVLDWIYGIVTAALIFIFLSQFYRYPDEEFGADGYIHPEDREPPEPTPIRRGD